MNRFLIMTTLLILVPASLETFTAQISTAQIFPAWAAVQRQAIGETFNFHK